MNDDDILKDTITITGGGYCSTDYDYTVSPMNMAAYTYISNPGNVTGSVTLPTSTSSSTYTISNGTWGSLSNNYVGSTTSNGSIHVQGDAHFDNDIKIKGRSLVDFIETLEKRLAILTPDPKKLEKYEALQKAYKHYKMLEALCEADDESEK